MIHSLDSTLAELMVSGGDNRLLPDADGLNPYGCSPLPRSTIAFGNCTCSSPSERGMSAVTATLQRLRESSSPNEEASRISRDHRRLLRRLLTLPDSVDVAFAASGTDVELLVLALAAGSHNRPIVNIIVGPTEVGSGTQLAAAGCHYDTLVPGGRQVRKGSPVSETLASRCTVRTIDIRDARGKMLSEFAIDTLVTETVAAEIEGGAQVILHLVAHSKTGMHAPSLSCVDRISRHMGELVTVVIDACQGRVSRRGLREILQAGHMVMFTGSKFYGGPPFSGALLIPRQWQPQQRCVGELPNGFGDYFTVPELPESWTSIRQALARRTNYGALLRWAAALEEMAAYYQVSSNDRLQVLRRFEETVPRLYEHSRAIRMLPVFPPVIDHTQTRLLESKTTVFAFRVFANDAPLDRDALRELHQELNTDVSASYPQLPGGVMRPTFHLGQPVPFADGSAALRIALGGALIVKVATDTNLGSSLGERIDWLSDQLQYLRTKLEFLAAERSTSTAQPVRT